MKGRYPIATWGGAALSLGGLLFFANKLDEMSRLFFGRWIPDVISGQDVLLVICGQVALILGFAAFYRTYAQRAGRLAKNALRLLCGGGILLSVGHVGFMPAFDFIAQAGFEPFILVFAGVAALILGLIVFGAANLRQPVLGGWRWLPLLTGLMGFIGFFLFSGEEINATFLMFRSLFALGLVGLGLVLAREKPRSLGEQGVGATAGPA